MEALIGKRYAKAIFDIAKERNQIQQIEEDLQLITDAFSENNELYELFNNPKLKLEEKKDLFNNIFKASVSIEVQEFFYVLLEKGRQKHVFSIFREYINLSDELNNLIRATVYSVIPLNDNEMQKINDKLTVMMGKQILLNNEINNDLIGGIYIKAADKIIDGSVKGKLAEMKKLLLA